MSSPRPPQTPLKATGGAPQGRPTAPQIVPAQKPLTFAPIPPTRTPATGNSPSQPGFPDATAENALLPTPPVAKKGK